MNGESNKNGVVLKMKKEREEWQKSSNTISSADFIMW